MINKTEYETLKTLMHNKGELEQVLRGMDSVYVETTIGLISVYGHNSPGQSHAGTEVHENADKFHVNCFDIEEELKAHARGLIRAKIGKIDVDISRYLDLAE